MQQEARSVRHQSHQDNAHHTIHTCVVKRKPQISMLMLNEVHIQVHGPHSMSRNAIHRIVFFTKNTSKITLADWFAAWSIHPPLALPQTFEGDHISCTRSGIVGELHLSSSPVVVNVSYFKDSCTMKMRNKLRHEFSGTFYMESCLVNVVYEVHENFVVQVPTICHAGTTYLHVIHVDLSGSPKH